MTWRVVWTLPTVRTYCTRPHRSSAPLGAAPSSTSSRSAPDGARLVGAHPGREGGGGEQLGGRAEEGGEEVVGREAPDEDGVADRRRGLEAAEMRAESREAEARRLAPERSPLRSSCWYACSYVLDHGLEARRHACRVGRDRVEPGSSSIPAGRARSTAVHTPSSAAFSSSAAAAGRRTATAFAAAAGASSSPLASKKSSSSALALSGTLRVGVGVDRRRHWRPPPR